jgi:hypothetical protein
VFWYAFLRIFIDLFRDYPTHRLAIGTGQTLNLLMAGIGAALLARSRLRRLGRLSTRQTPAAEDSTSAWISGRLHRGGLIVIMIFSLTIPSNWTQDVPTRYGKRHAGLKHSIVYPRINTAPPATRPDRASRD